MTTTLPLLPGEDERERRPFWSTRDGVLPRRDDLVDALGAVLLAGFAVLGFQHVYLGPAYLALGVAGAVAGAVAAFLITRLVLRFVLALPLSILLFIVAGGPAVAESSIAGLLPGPGTPGALLSGATQGWANLLTTAPPVGIATGLGVVPYLCGFVAGGAAMLAARSRTWPIVPVAAPVVVLMTGFLFGTHAIVSTVVQGALFAVVAIGWGAVRSNRSRRSEDGQIHWPRLFSGLAMLAILFIVAVPVGTRLPFVDGSRREVLRDRFLPPFDPRNEPSPLASFRSYLGNDTAKQTVFTVEGLPAGARLRLATMDTFDGVVWVVGGPAAPASGRFERVGAAIEPVPDGRPATVTVAVASDRADVWVPTVGSTHGADFSGPRAVELGESFRYNRATGAGAAPVRLDRGDQVTLRAQLAPARDDAALKNVPIDGSAGLPAPPELPEGIGKKATDMAGTGSPYEQALKLEQTLAKDGFYSDGGADSKGTARESAPGHSVFRVLSFLENKRGFIGDAEQFAATMAMLARSIGLPARVVMGFNPPEGSGPGPTELHGSDVDAWVEVAFAGRGWVAFYPTPDHKKAPPDIPQEKPKEKDLERKQPPPPTFLEAPDLIAELGAQRPDAPKPSEKPAEITVEGGAPLKILGVASIPIVAVLVSCGLIVMLKARRRTRRRSRGTPVQRLAGAWLEVCDQARDAGVVIPADATRREIAALIPVDVWVARNFADQVDDAMFGFVDPDDALVARLWAEADRERDAIIETLTTKQHLRAALSLLSLRPKRAARRARAAARAAVVAAAKVADGEAEAAEQLRANAGSPPATDDDPRVLETAGRGR